MCGCTSTQRMRLGHRDLLDARIVDADGQHQAADTAKARCCRRAPSRWPPPRPASRTSAARCLCSGSSTSALAATTAGHGRGGRPAEARSRAECPSRSRISKPKRQLELAAQRQQRTCRPCSSRPRAAGPRPRRVIERMRDARLGAPDRASRGRRAHRRRNRGCRSRLATLPTLAGANAVAEARCPGVVTDLAPRYATDPQQVGEHAAGGDVRARRRAPARSAGSCVARGRKRTMLSVSAMLAKACVRGSSTSPTVAAAFGVDAIRRSAAPCRGPSRPRSRCSMAGVEFAAAAPGTRRRRSRRAPPAPGSRPSRRPFPSAGPSRAPRMISLRATSVPERSSRGSGSV